MAVAPRRRRSALQTAAAAWEAFRAPEPDELAELTKQGTPGLPFLTPALKRLLEELPAPRDGLSTTERRALQAVADGATTPIAAFVAAPQREPVRFLGDAWFFRALTRAGSAASRRPRANHSPHRRL